MAKIDEFRTSALHFKEFGTYTKLPKGSRSYKSFWDEETRRCQEGYHCGWNEISGYFYWYLNYSPIQIVTPRLNEHGIVIVNEDGSIQGDRSEDFPMYWDGDEQYYYYLDQAEKAGKHGVVLKTRGRGYSFKGGSMLNRNYFLYKNSKSYAIASEKEFLIKDGILSKAWEMMSFIDKYTPWAKRRQFADLPMHKRASFRSTLDGIEVEDGYKSEIIGITLKNDPQRARGKRGKLILWEEGGKFPGLLQAWQIARPSMEQGKITFGLMVAFGTGGTEGGDFDGLGELFDNPKGYNILPVDNVWDEGVEGKTSGHFVPEYMNMEGCMDENGTSDIDKARKIIFQDRKIVLENTRDTNAFKRYIAEKPVTPREAMMKLSGNIFPVQDLAAVLARLELDRDYEKSLTKGFFTIEQDGTLLFTEDKAAKIIYNYPVRKEDNKNAPIIIYEPPITDKDGNIPYGIYIAGIDPYDHDASQTDSLGSTFIINKLTQRIVAEYTARPETADEYYEQTRRLLLYYNARALYENEKIGIFKYFENYNCLYLLCEEPNWLQEIIKKPGASRKYGLRMPVEVKNYGTGLIKQWLLRDYDSTKFQKNYHKIRSRGLLEELMKYDPEKNADRVMALMCLMYQMETDRRYIPDEPDNNLYIPMSKRGLFGKTFRTKIPVN